MAKVDCTHEPNQEVCAQFNVRGFPTLILLKDDKYFKHKGPRDFDSLENFALTDEHTYAETQGPIPPKSIYVSRSNDGSMTERDTLRNGGSGISAYYNEFSEVVNRLF